MPTYEPNKSADAAAAQAAAELARSMKNDRVTRLRAGPQPGEEGSTWSGADGVGGMGGLAQGFRAADGERMRDLVAELRGVIIPGY